jgi:hypothetical protein
VRKNMAVPVLVASAKSTLNLLANLDTALADVEHQRR